MKSNKFLSLVMAAVMSISALCVYAMGAESTGLTAFAGVTYSDGSSDISPTPDRYVTITMSTADIQREWENNRIYAYCDKKVDHNHDFGLEWCTKSHFDATGSTPVETYYPPDAPDAQIMRVYGIPFSYFTRVCSLNLDRMKSFDYEVYGWCLHSGASSGNIMLFTRTFDEDGSCYKVVSDEYSKGIDLTDKGITTEEGARMYILNDGSINVSGDGFVCTGFENIKITLRPVYRKLTEKELLQKLRAQKIKENREREEKERLEYVTRLARKNGAKNNVIDKDGEIKSALETISTRSTSGVYTKGDIKSIKKAVGITEESNEIAFVYEVKPSTINKDYVSLISGKNLMARLELPSGYKTSGYSAYVYYVTHSGVKRLTKVDVGKRDVMFFTRDFGSYVLRLVPGSAKYENPPTADASAVPVMLLAAASLSAAGSTIIRRKREIAE